MFLFCQTLSIGLGIAGGALAGFWFGRIRARRAAGAARRPLFQTTPLGSPDFFAPVLIENAKDSIYTLSRDGVIVYLNSEFERLTGWPRSDWIGRSFVEILHPEDAPLAEERFRRLCRGETLPAVQLRIRIRTGEYRIGDFKTIPLRHGAGIVGLLGIATDITQNRRLEEALRESERFLGGVFESIQDGIVVLDKELTILRTNPTLEKWFAHEMPVAGRKCYEAFHGRSRPCRDCPGLRTLTTGLASRENLTETGFARTRVGTREVFVFPFTDPATGECKGVIEYVRDITDSLQAEDKFRHLVELSLVGIYNIQDNRFDYVNPRMADIFGYTVEEMLALPSAYQIACEEDRSVMVENVRKRLEGETASIRYTFHGRKKDGTALEIEAHGSVMESDGRRIIIGTLLDITESKRLEERLRQSQKMEAVGRLAGGVAHDFNNLLMAITGYAELLLMGMTENDPLRRDAGEIVRAAERGAALTRQLLAYSRRQMLRPIVLNVNFVIGNLQSMLGQLLGEDVKMKLDLAKDLRMIRADPGNVEQVIVNLAVNARDAMPEGGCLTIRTGNTTLAPGNDLSLTDMRPGNYVLLTIEDTGVGMDAEIVQRIFEPFFSTKEIGKGTGLGLAVVYGIVKQHEGWIQLQTSPGQGTAFRIFLPALSSGAETEADNRRIKQICKGRGERILLVEDEDQVRELAARALAENGYIVFQADGASEARRIFETETARFNMVFCDVVLPDRSGLRLAEELRLLKPDLKIILTSGYADHKAQWPMIRTRGYAFLQKPYMLQDMLHIIREILAAEK